MAISENTETMLKKLAFGLVGTLSTLMVKYVAKLGEEFSAMRIEIAQIHQMVGAHERQLNSIDNLSQTVYRIESKVQTNTGRIDNLEKNEDRYGRRK